MKTIITKEITFTTDYKQTITPAFNAEIDYDFNYNPAQEQITQ